ncbi:hypothetical protein V8B55DRAFT_1100601 [Mucor lusitanicus]|uniref:HNH nuclease domain-containing protein n=2 Tax=Mucor circinelloides f. lusitanicus TaxID=29924 RepID=A0A168PSG2_MUCCL|nr:hypothetical protein FB192DRAFT_1445861 [Mucor lusitanicus]OAD08154.1 hypothetical protein MUCCIDRAFT_76927 [Mucor lusitanicus CBS 277.49]
MTVLDTFVGIDLGKREAIFVNGDITDTKLANLKHATFEEKRQYLIQQLELQNPGETFKAVDNYDNCCHSKHLVSDQGRVFSYAKTTMTLLKPQIALNEHAIIRMNEHSHTLYKIVYVAFKGPIQPRYKVVHKDGDKANNKLSNLICVLKVSSQCMPTARDGSTLYDLLEALPSKEDYDKEQWKHAKTGSLLIKELPSDYMASNLGRIKVNGSIKRQCGFGQGYIINQ